MSGLRARLRGGIRPITFIVGFVLTSGAAAGEDRPPKPPLKDFADKPGCAVSEVRAGDVFVARVPDEARVVRLIGVEIPSRDGCAREAQAFLARLLTGESVYLEYEAEGPQRDRDGQTRAYVYRAPDGLFINLELVRLGYARVSSSGRCSQEALLRAYEQIARKAHKGLWAAHKSDEADEQAAAASSPAAVSDNAATQPAAADGPSVYVTTSGKKYHTKDCQFARHGATAMTIKEAKARGLTPCARCKPPE